MIRLGRIDRVRPSRKKIAAASFVARPTECLVAASIYSFFREREDDGLPLVQIVKLESLAVVHQNGAQALAFRQRVEILPGLLVRLAEIAPCAFLSDEQHAPARTDR